MVDRLSGEMLRSSDPAGADRALIDAAGNPIIVGAGLANERL